MDGLNDKGVLCPYVAFFKGRFVLYMNILQSLNIYV